MPFGARGQRRVDLLAGMAEALLIPLMVWATYALPTLGLGALIGVFILVAAWEWAGLCGILTGPGRILYIVSVALAGVLLYRAPIAPVMWLSALWWLWAIFEMLYHRDVHAGLLASRAGKLVSGLFVLVPTWIAPLWLHARPAEGWMLVLFLLVLVWSADSGAYFAGKAWGKTKIAPHISPGKSLEGVLGGLVAVVLVALMSGLWVWRFTPNKLLVWVLLAMGVALISVLGDLMESRYKRAAGVKDSGHLLPGHGGVLDRIDAFTAAAPFFVLGWIYLGLAA